MNAAPMYTDTNATDKFVSFKVQNHLRTPIKPVLLLATRLVPRPGRTSWLMLYHVEQTKRLLRLIKPAGLNPGYNHKPTAHP